MRNPTRRTSVRVAVATLASLCLVGLLSASASSAAARSSQVRSNATQGTITAPWASNAKRSAPAATTAQSRAKPAVGKNASLFNAASAFNTPIPANVKVDPKSDAIVRQWVSPQPFYANTMDWGRTFYRSNASDPVFEVGVDMAPQWGPDPFTALIKTKKGNTACNPLHIPKDATIPTGTDRWVIIEDTTKPGIYCELWATTNNDGQWHASFGSVFDKAGNGTDMVAGGGTGAGMSALAGLITFDDIRRGSIDHALVFPGACNGPEMIRLPATKSDGVCNASNPMATGMRFQLDPTFECATLDVRIEQVICVALQKYGAINGDQVSTDPVIANSLYFQTDDPTDPNRSASQPGDPTRPGALYHSVGLTQDYQSFAGLPMDRMRLIVM